MEKGHTRYPATLYESEAVKTGALAEVVSRSRPCDHEDEITFVGSVADDGPGLAGAGLSVGEEGAVEALPGVVQDPSTDIFENPFLE